MTAEDAMAYLAPFTEPLRTETFRFNRRWLQGQAERVGDLRGPQFNTGRELNLPPQYLLVHRVTMGTLGVLCQLDADVAAARHRAAAGSRGSSTRTGRAERRPLHPRESRAGRPTAPRVGFRGAVGSGGAAVRRRGPRARRRRPSPVGGAHLRMLGGRPVAIPGRQESPPGCRRGHASGDGMGRAQC